MNWEKLAGRRLNEEIEQHLQDRYEELLARGASASDAQRIVLADVERRDGDRPIPPPPATPEPLLLGAGGREPAFAGLSHDVRYGTRLAIKDRGTALVIVLTLALAIAANGVVFGFADLLLIRPLPVGNAARFISLYSQEDRQDRNRERLSIPEFLDVRQRATSLVDVAGMRRQQMSLTGTGEARAVTVQLTTANLHQLWQLGASAGRVLRPADGDVNRRDVAVLSHRYWAGQMASDPSVVGRTVALNGVKYTVVGVMAPAIEIGNLEDIDVWLPLDTSTAARRDDRVLSTFALLKPGVTVAAASAELAAIGEQLGREHPLTDGGRRLFAISLRDSIGGRNTWLVLAFLGIIVLLVLVVACANVATVMLARASGRRREIAVRIALGASRGRLLRQLGVEGLLLGLASGAAGLLLTDAGLRAFKAYSVETFFQSLAINRNMLLFTLALSIVAPLLFAVLPALQMARPDLNEDLKDGGRDARPSARGHRSRAVLVVAQVAFALVALIIAGLIVRTIVAMKHVPLGFAPDGVLTLRVRLDPPKYNDEAERQRMVDSLLDRLAAVPGVTAAGAMAGIPLLDGEPARRFTISGRPAPAPADLPWAVEAATAGDYISTLNVRLLEGRFWRADDRAASWAVVAVNREVVRRYWPGRTAIGEHITPLDASGNMAGQPLEIVGVVDDIVGTDVDVPPPPRIYRPLAARTPDSIVLAVRSSGDAAALAPIVRETVRASDADLPISQMRPLAAQVREFLRETELLVAMFAVFAAIALVVAIAGIYGVTAFAVGQRRHEIGVRLALGATGREVVRLVVWQSARLVAIGGIAGLAGGLALAQAMRTLLTNDVSSVDPLTYATVVTLLATCALVASYVPAHRVLSIDPAAVLKRE